MVQYKIIDTSREIIAGYEKKDEIVYRGFTTEEQMDEIGEFKANIITLLTSLLEGEVNIMIIDRMTKGLEFSSMKIRMETIFIRFANKILEKEDLTIPDIPFFSVN